MSFNGPDDVLTNRKYNLTCKVRFLEKDVREELGRGKVNQYHRKLVLLVPEQNDEAHRFFQAWLPDTAEEYFEIATQIGSPLHSPSRVAIKRGHDGVMDRPYLTVMSVGAEEVLKSRCLEGQSIRVTTMPASEEDEADQALDASDGNYQAIEQ